MALLPGALGIAFAADGPRRNFDVAAGEAAERLRQFAAQAQCEIIFPADAVAGVKTNAVKGALAPHHALERLVARTGLVIVRDEKTGAFMVKPATRARGDSGSRPSESPSESRSPKHETVPKLEK